MEDFVAMASAKDKGDVLEPMLSRIVVGPDRVAAPLVLASDRDSRGLLTITTFSNRQLRLS